MKKIFLSLLLSLLLMTVNESKAQAVVTDPGATAASIAGTKAIVGAITTTQLLSETSNTFLQGLLGSMDEYVQYARSALRIANDLISLYGSSREFVYLITSLSESYNLYFKCLEKIIANPIYLTQADMNTLILMLDYATFAIRADVTGLDRQIKGLENIAGGALGIIPQIASSITSGSTLTIRDINIMIKEAKQTTQKHVMMTRNMSYYIDQCIYMRKVELGFYEDLYNTRDLRKKFKLD